MEIKAKKQKRSLRDSLRPYGYLSPALISISLLSLLPILYTIYIAFTNYSVKHLDDYTFVGFKNFANILTGPLSKVFLPVFIWTFIYAILSVLGTYFIGLLFAIVLNNPDMKESNVYKAFLVIPWALPATIAILSWKGLLHETYGGINILLQNLGIISDPIPWMSNVFWARFGLIIVNLWLGFPYMMNVCLGALSAIPQTYYEAADIDGANWWTKFTKITLPSIMSSTLPLLISSFAFNFNNFMNAFLITGGGPRVAGGSQFAGSTDILISAAYKLAMNNNLFNIASALSVLIFIVIGTLSLINMKMSGAFKEVD